MLVGFENKSFVKREMVSNSAEIAKGLTLYSNPSDYYLVNNHLYEYKLLNFTLY